MRIDLFLKHTRLIKRRTIAKNFCLKGLVLINDKIAKPSSEVNDGDNVTIFLGDKAFTVVASIEEKGKVVYLSYDKVEENEA